MRKSKLFALLCMLLIVMVAVPASASILDSLKDAAQTAKDTISSGVKAVLEGGSQNPIRVYVDGNLVYFPDQQPYIDSNDRTLVPVRFVSEALGAEVDWIGQKQEVDINHEAKGKRVLLWVGKRDYTVNGVTARMDTQAVLTDQARVMVPLRFVSEALGADVRWEVIAGNGTVFTFTLGQSDEEIKAVIDRVRAELEGKPPVTDGRDTKGWPEVDPDGKNYGLSNGWYENHYMSVSIRFEEPSFDPTKVRKELTRIITACGYTEAQAKEVIDYALTKDNREVRLENSFFRDGSSRIRVSSAIGADIVAVDIGK